MASKQKSTVNIRKIKESTIDQIGRDFNNIFFDLERYNGGRAKIANKIFDQAAALAEKVQRGEEPIGKLFEMARQSALASEVLLMGYAQLSNEDNFTVAHVVAQSHPTIAFKIYTRFKDTLGKLATKDGTTVNDVALRTIRDYDFELRK